MDNPVDVDEHQDRVTEILESESVTIDGTDVNVGKMMGDIKTAHRELDEYKAGCLSTAQTLSEAADAATDDVRATVLTDMSEAAMAVYLRVQRGDLEVTGERDGEYSGYMNE